MNLAKRLVEKGAIREDTEIEAYYRGHSLSCLDDARLIGRFKLKVAKLSADKTQMIFEALSPDRRVYRLSNDDVVNLDGMPPDRLASIYNLNIRGEDVAPGKRRGRRPKVA
jgi:hypothetical protein